MGLALSFDCALDKPLASPQCQRRKMTITPVPVVSQFPEGEQQNKILRDASDFC